MSNFFRDNNIGFKPRSNIFSKMRAKDSNRDVDTDTTDSILMDSPFFHQHDSSKLAGGSVENMTAGTSFVGSAQESTPKRAKIVLSGMTCNSEGVAGSEVQGVAHSDSSDVRCKGVVKGAVVDTSSNDVLLEAFTNTQRICASLKRDLHEQQSKNKQQRQEIEKYKRDIDKIREKVGGYQALLDALGDKSKWLIERKKINDKNVEHLNQSYDSMTAKVQQLQEQSNTLNITIGNMRTGELERESELRTKNKEIEYLRNEVNNFSVQLEEERARNSILVQQFDNMRKEIKGIAEELFHKQGAALMVSFKNIVDGIEAVKATVVHDVSQRFRRLEDMLESSKIFQGKEKDMLLTIIDEIRSNDGKLICRYEDFNKKFLNLEDISKSLSTKFDMGFDELIGKCQQSNDLYKHMSLVVLKSKENVIDHLDRSAADLKNHFQTSEGSLAESLMKLDKHVDQFSKKLDKNEKYELMVVDLQDQLHKISMKKSEIVAILKTKDLEIENLNNQLYKRDEAMEELQMSKSTIMKDLSEFKQASIKSNDDYKKLSEEALSCKATYQEKLTAQNEIVRLLTHETESLKFKLHESEMKNSGLENEKQEIQDKMQGLQESLHKLNIEVVQLKAHELEIEDEARKLRENLKNIEAAEKEDDLKMQQLKEQVKSMDLDRRNFITEKLDYQDKFEMMEKQISQLRKQLQKAKDFKDVGNMETIIHNSQPEQHRDYKVQQKQQQEQQEQPIQHDLNLENQGQKQQQKHKQPQLKQKAFYKQNFPVYNTENNNNLDVSDEFDLSSSINDDLELTNRASVPTVLAPTRRKSIVIKATTSVKKSSALKNGRKKLLLSDDNDEFERKFKKKKF